MQKIPEDKNHILFIENHDMDRWASAMDGHTGKIRCAAVLNLTLPGIPALYYGQELGVTGMVGNWGHDGNHIPVREAFPWFADPGASGMAVWYKNSGPWWDGSYYQSEAVQDFAFSAQKDKPGSLWNLYRQLIDTRKTYVEFQKGRYQPLMPSDSVVFAFARELESERSVVIMNLSDTTRIIDPGPLDAYAYDALLSEGANREENAISLGPYAFIILKK